MQRRTLLRRGVLVGIAGSAGCLGGSGSGPTTTEPPTETDEPMTDTDAPSPTPSPEPTTTQTPEPSSATPSPTATETASPTPTAAQTVTVGPGGALRFEPSSFEVAAGELVRWVWDASGHNVKPGSTPAGVDWGGTPGGEFETFDAGYTYSYRFEAGEYEYYCAPHRSAGMTGSFTVTEGGSDPLY